MLLASAASASPSSVQAEVIAVFEINTADVVGFTPASVEKFTNILDAAVTSNGYHAIPRSEIRARLVLKQARAH